jgi:outer membrane biogenesis lipoprotein LolB
MWLLGILLPLALALASWLNGRVTAAESWQIGAERQLSEIRTDVRWIREAIARRP